MTRWRRGALSWFLLLPLTFPLVSSFQKPLVLPRRLTATATTHHYPPHQNPSRFLFKNHSRIKGYFWGTFQRRGVMKFHTFGSALRMVDEQNFGEESSQMNQFIRQYLRKTNPEQQELITEEDSPSYLIAMPLDHSCQELLLELESVQRAILYHCPLLVHACRTMIHLPLLYVYATSSGRSISPSSTQKLQDIITKVVQQHFFSETLKKPTEDNEGELSSWLVPNEDGYLPFGIQFQGLQVEELSNSILYCTLRAEDPATERLVQFIDDLRRSIESEMGCLCKIPHPAAASKISTTPLPRVPFMKLPADWDSRIRQMNAPENEEGGESAWLTSDQGGNGISPIFWIQWENDVFGKERSRMAEVALYSHTGDAERPFYVPDWSVDLPEANSIIAQHEKYYRNYQENRMIETEIELNEEKEMPSSSLYEDGSEAAMSSTKEQLANILEENEEKYIDAFDIDMREEEEPKVTREENEMTEIGSAEDRNDWTKERLRKIVASREKVKSEQMLSQTPKSKPPITENEVFKKYKEGTLAPNERRRDQPRALPPYPSYEHCTGFWRMLSSPTGFPVEEGDDSRSDNLILRVDGTTAGGPILDTESLQKASGGTWKLLGESAEDAQLRIRLVIPPEKERILVMNGNLERASMNDAATQLARNTFGIPLLEERSNQDGPRVEDLLYCTGPVHVEDARTGANVEHIGTFSMMKLSTPSDPEQFVITIPKPVRQQD